MRLSKLASIGVRKRNELFRYVTEYLLRNHRRDTTPGKRERRFKMKEIFKAKEKKEVFPDRLQYDLKTAAYLLCTSINTAKKWCGQHLYKMNGVGDNFIGHDDLADVIRNQREFNRFCESVYGGKQNGQR